MHDILDLERYPLDHPGTPAYRDMVDAARTRLARDGLFNLVGLMRPEALRQLLAHVQPLMKTESFHHTRWHNIYFEDTVDGVDPNDPALQKVETSNHTLCHDQMRGTALDRLYAWPPFIRFLEAVTDQPRLHIMDDALAGINVMEYRAGEALNWHFDRSVFTTTLLLQEATEGGAFEYAQDLRSAEDPNHAGIAALLQGQRETRVLQQSAGTLNVFLGVNTAHRVSPVVGETARIVAVLSHYPEAGRAFTPSEQMGFFGRVA